MILASFLVATAAVLFALAVIQAGRRRKLENDRRELEAEVESFLDRAQAKNPEHAEGYWRGMHARIDVNHFSIDYQLQLTPAVIPYRELMARHAPDLAETLRSFDMRVDEHDRIIGSVPRETELSENLVTVENRFPLAQRVLELRHFAPLQLVRRIETAHSTREIDELLIALATHFPDAPEMADAIEAAAEREHTHPDRVRERAEKWLTRVPVAATPS